MRILLFVIISVFTLASCSSLPIGTGGAKIYRISAGKASKVQFSMLDSVNSLRQVAGVGSVTLDPQLNAAAVSHAEDMSRQNRPWNFGSDGSSPIQRASRAGYTGMYIGENIAETYESEVETLSAWMDRPDTRRIILDPRARSLGIGWKQERSGKIWWVVEMGG
jgi:uncharacterized protein YkwD